MKKLLHILIALSLMLVLLVMPTESAKAASFPDVSSFKQEIDYLTDLKIINGYTDGTFRPSVKLSRAQAVVMIMRAIGMPKSDINLADPGFHDVTRSSFGYKEIAVATAAGIINGKTPTRFDPSGNITRAEMAKVLTNAFKLKGVYDPGFKDVSTNYWASSSISSLAANNITIGFNDGTFRPTQPIDRAQFSAFLARIVNPNFRPSLGEPAHSVVDLTVESTIVDIVKNPDKPIVYYLDEKSQSLIMLDLKTKSKKVVELTYPAERLVIKNGKIFVTQLIQERSPYNFMEMQKGLIHVYDADNLSFLKAVNVNIDPFDIAVDDTETLIISSGSDQGIRSEIHTYNWQTSEYLSSANLFPKQHIELSPTQNKVYTVHSSHYTGKIEAFSLVDGKIQKETTASRFFDTSKLRGYAKLSLDGKVIYNGNGTAYASSNVPSEDLAPLGKLATPFTTITFDEAEKNMYLADNSEEISIYKFDTLKPISTLHAYGKIDHLVYVEETKELYAFTKFKYEGSQTESVLLERFTFGE